jgi:2-iminobutanoate/2-iminopropanoate deaminase
MRHDDTRELTPIQAKAAPRAIGPYSQAIVASNGRLLFLSGQLGIDPETGKLVRGGVAEQTRQVMHNLRSVLQAAGGKLTDVVKMTIFLKNLGDFSTVNAIYASYLHAPYPARETVEVSRLPADGLIEISAIAIVDLAE